MSPTEPYSRFRVLLYPEVSHCNDGDGAGGGGDSNDGGNDGDGGGDNDTVGGGGGGDTDDAVGDTAGGGGEGGGGDGGGDASLVQHISHIFKFSIVTEPPENQYNLPSVGFMPDGPTLPQ